MEPAMSRRRRDRKSISYYEEIFGSPRYARQEFSFNDNMLVMVYGSLKEGFGNHRLLIGQEYLGTFHTQDEDFFMISLGGFPGVHRGGAGRIQGEIYRVTEECFRRLDGLEGNGFFYTREEVDAYKVYGTDDKLVTDLEMLRAWMYILPRDDRSYGIAPDDKEELEGLKGTFTWMYERRVGLYVED
jgi:gamma-glutamylcyclotransferase (GGCT)/AIG2-like uncharacterized protein YtfP